MIERYKDEKTAREATEHIKKIIEGLDYYGQGDLATLHDEYSQEFTIIRSDGRAIKIIAYDSPDTVVLRYESQWCSDCDHENDLSDGGVEKCNTCLTGKVPRPSNFE